MRMTDESAWRPDCEAGKHRNRGQAAGASLRGASRTQEHR